MVNYKLMNSDYILTPKWCAEDMINYFNPSGKILDPCRGLNHVFWNNLDSAEWCEIQEGKDFFNYTEKVDWIIGNPPYSIFYKWLKHSYNLSENIVYLLPTFKIFNALNLIRFYRDNGLPKHIRVYDTGKAIEWARSRPIAAVHFQKNYFGETSWSFVKHVKL